MNTHYRARFLDSFADDNGELLDVKIHKIEIVSTKYGYIACFNFTQDENYTLC